jgi:4-hydroxy-tetrahydrodipicolinate reductase
MGDVVGEHTSYFSGNAERLELTHRAHTRMAFAAGALVAASWVAAQKVGGLYSMADVLGIGSD